MVLYELIGGILLALQLAAAISVFAVSNKSVGTISSATSYIFSSFILLMLGTGTYLYGGLFFSDIEKSLIASSYFILGIGLNTVKIFVIDPKAKESNIERISENVHEFFGD